MMEFIRILKPKYCLIIVDYKLYRDMDIDEWNKKTFKYDPREGLVLTFANEKDLLYFLLVWE